MLQRSQSPFVLTALLVSSLSLLGCNKGGDEGGDEPATEESGEESAESASAGEAVEGSHRIDVEVVEDDDGRALLATVVPGDGYKCNVDYPRWNVQVADDAPAAAGVRQGKDDAVTFEDSSVSWRIPIEDGASAGDVMANVHFGVCDDEACITLDEEVTWTLASAE